MHEVYINFAELLVTLGVIVILIMMVRQDRTQRDLSSQLTLERAERTQLKKDFRALLSCSRNLGDKLRQQKEKQQSMLQQIQSMETQGDGDLAVTHAAKLVAKGIELEEISRICELTQGEVELLSRLSKHRKAA